MHRYKLVYIAPCSAKLLQCFGEDLDEANVAVWWTQSAIYKLMMNLSHIIALYNWDELTLLYGAHKMFIYI